MKVMLSDTDIKKIVQNGAIIPFNTKITKKEFSKLVGPGSVDIPLGPEIVQLKNGYRPHNSKVIDIIRENKIKSFYPEGIVEFNKECHYASPALHIKKNKFLEDRIIEFSPKSSVGRIDNRVRTIADNFEFYDSTPSKFKGDIWNILSPQCFNTYIDFNDVTDKWSTMNQARIILENYDFNEMPKSKVIFKDKNGKGIDKKVYDGSTFTMSLSTKDFDIVGYEALETDEPLNVGKEKSNPLSHFFKPIERCEEFPFELNKFYLAASKELLVVPPEYSVRVVAVAEGFEVVLAHRAGFADSGFGYKNGNRLVFEIRTLEKMKYKDGTPFCKVEVYKNLTRPEIIYGKKTGSHYISQTGVVPAKYFYNDLLGEERK